MFLAFCSIIPVFLANTWQDDARNILLFCLLFYTVVGDQRQLWQAMRRSWQLLRWILLPTFFLHALMTPGALLYPDILPWLSREGVMLGWQLCWHWSSIFVLAIFLGYLFPVMVWLKLLDLFPRWNMSLQPYVRLFPGMNRLLRALIRRRYRQWKKLPHKFQSLPVYLADLLWDMQVYAQRHALYLWRHWDDKPVNEASMQAVAYPLWGMGLGLGFALLVLVQAIH